MCGFAGIYSGSINNSLLNKDLLSLMGDRIAHRGPDDSGVWMNESLDVGFVHRRLSILDLSSNGHQPMHSKSGRYTIAFNGEIYNHLELREELTGVNWISSSDTETLLAAFDSYGINKALRKSRGMFAFTLWDNENRQLILGRDRFGEKPLYYGWQNNVFLFGSELKSLRVHPSFINEIDTHSLSNFIQTGFVTKSKSIYKNMAKLEPGSILVLDTKTNKISIDKFWNLENVILSGVSSPFKGTPDEAATYFEKLLNDVLKEQMLSDVPLGAFLSGGVDSSAIVSLMQKQSNSKIKTFTIGFDDKNYNEAEFAHQVAAHIGTDHTELYLTAEDALNTIPLLPEIYDEPFADTSQIPTYLVAKLARQKVTVALSGDAGDELFCGYNRYMIAGKYWKMINQTPRFLREITRQVATSIKPSFYDAFLSCFSDRTNIGNLVYKGTNLLISKDIEELYVKLLKQDVEADICLNKTYPLLFDLPMPLRQLPLIERLMGYDLLNYLVDDILVKVDRAAMAVSLETRVPFLDHRIVEFAWSLPLSYKNKKGVSKKVLRDVLYRNIPKSLIERPKAGFGIPIDEWLRGPLKDWASDLLNEQELNEISFFNVSVIHRVWTEHQNYKKNHGKILWNILMFMAWYKNQK